MNHLSGSECKVGTEHWKEDVRIEAGLPASSMEIDGRHHPFALNLWDGHLRRVASLVKRSLLEWSPVVEPAE